MILSVLILLRFIWSVNFLHRVVSRRGKKKSEVLFDVRIAACKRGEIGRVARVS